MNAAMKRWGKLWDVLGFQDVGMGYHVQKEVVFSYAEDTPRRRRRRYCFDWREVNGVARYYVATIPSRHPKDRNFITPHEADILSDLLLGTDLANDKTNYI